MLFLARKWKTFARFQIVTIGLLCAGTALTRGENPVDNAPLSSEGIEQFDRKWEKFSKREPGLSSREVYQFLLSAAAHRWRPEKWEAVVDLVESMHDRDSASDTYGNYRWYWHETKPDDRNAVEFCMQLAGLTWALYRDIFPAGARDKLRAALTLGAEGAVRQKVPVSYTNIFLMRLSNCILIGEQLDRPDLVEKGRRWLDEWIDYTRAHGIHEYSSPTYYAVDLEDLGILARYAKDVGVREKAVKGLRLFWTDIALNFFEPHGGLGGAHSRDYDFLAGHGDLDRHLVLAGWIPGEPEGETRSMLTELAHVGPPVGVVAGLEKVPRVVSQSWGEKEWERATHYVGRNFSLGSAGASYNAQDNVLAIALKGGPRRPLVNFSLDYRGDAYGEAKIMTSGSHPKLTHLVPFVASVQKEAEVLMIASVDPAKTANPAGKNQPMEYADVNANFVLPEDVECWQARTRVLLGKNERRLRADRPLYLRDGDTGIALWFVFTRNSDGKSADVRLINDGSKQKAMRLTATLAAGAPRGRVTAVVWVRAAEKLDDAGFSKFQKECDDAAEKAKVQQVGRELDVRVRGKNFLRIKVDLESEKRIEIDGADPGLERGILNVNGRDVGAEIFR